MKFSVFSSRVLGITNLHFPLLDFMGSMVLMSIFHELNVFLKILCFELFRFLVFRYVLFSIHRLKDSSPYWMLYCDM